MLPMAWKALSVHLHKRPHLSLPLSLSLAVLQPHWPLCSFWNLLGPLSHRPLYLFPLFGIHLPWNLLACSSAALVFHSNIIFSERAVCNRNPIHFPSLSPFLGLFPPTAPNTHFTFYCLTTPTFCPPPM